MIRSYALFLIIMFYAFSAIASDIYTMEDGGAVVYTDNPSADKNYTNKTKNDSFDYYRPNNCQNQWGGNKKRTRWEQEQVMLGKIDYEPNDIKLCLPDGFIKSGYEREVVIFKDKRQDTSRGELRLYSFLDENGYKENNNYTEYVKLRNNIATINSLRRAGYNNKEFSDAEIITINDKLFIFFKSISKRKHIEMYMRIYRGLLILLKLEAKDNEVLSELRNTIDAIEVP